MLDNIRGAMMVDSRRRYSRQHSAKEIPRHEASVIGIATRRRIGLAIRRHAATGAQPIRWLGMAGELQRDWARTKRIEEVFQLFRDHAGAASSVLAWEMQLLRAKDVEWA